MGVERNFSRRLFVEEKIMEMERAASATFIPGGDAWLNRILGARGRTVISPRC
jgi:hypothetical protein